MIVGKYLVSDLTKLHTAILASRRAHTFSIVIDGPKILISFDGDDSRLTTVTLFDESERINPTISKTEVLT